MFERVEKNAYSSSLASVTYEAVSLALKEYMIHHFETKAEKIILAQQDIPQAYSSSLIRSWRTYMRQQLALADDVKVYCYNGSAKAWQCPELVIEFFMKKYVENPVSFLLILTQDIHIFKNLLEKYAVPSSVFCLINVCYQEIYTYLAASDVGLLFRQPHIINWVSRPTKLLEYQAVGLLIEHNNTVGWLVHNDLKIKELVK
jgi:hypothetical protein